MTREKKKPTKGKKRNYLNESYNYREAQAEKERKRRERDKKSYRDNRQAYYEEDMTYEEVRAKRKEEQRRSRKKTSILEKVVIILTFAAIIYFGYNSLKATNLGTNVEVFAESGTLEKTISGKAKIIRDETVVYAQSEGDVEYYFHEGDKTKNGVAVCKVYEKTSSKELEEEIAELDEAIVKMQNKTQNESLKNELSEVDEYIYGLIDEYLVYKNTDYSFDVYDLKSELESKFAIKRNIYLQYASSSSSNQSYLNEREHLKETLDYNAVYLYAPKGGIVSYYIDGYEDSYTPEKIPELKGKYLQSGSSKLISGNKKTNVKKDEALFKIVDNTNWYITATLDQEETKNWTINDVKHIRVKNVSDDKIIGTIVNVLEYNKSNIITFKVTEQMNKYMAFRDIEIEVIESEVDGIKIPVSSIEARECIKLPKSSVLSKNGNYYVIKSESGSKKQQAIKIAYEGDEYYYVLASDGSVNKGEYVIVTNEVDTPSGKTTEEKPLMVGETVTLNGVYKITGSSYKFAIVDVLLSNDSYAIIKDNETGSLILYDKIILNASSINTKD